MQSQKQHIEWLDLLRAFATIGVIIIHVSTPVVKMSYGKDWCNWWTGNLFDSAVRFAVPLFLMLSGATMLGKEYDLKTFYKKRVTRVLFPFLFWMVAYWIYRWMVLPSTDQPQGWLPILQWGVRLLTHEGISKHFWYVYMILFFYLLFPFLSKGVRNLNRKELLGFVIGWALLSFFTRNMPVNFYNWTDGYPERLLAYFQYAGYLVLGYYLTLFRVERAYQRWMAAGLFIFTVLLAAGLTRYFSFKNHGLDLTMYGNVTFNSIAQATALFLLIKDYEIRHKWLLKLQHSISNYSYGIYLAHIMVIGIGFQYGIFWTMGNPLWTIPGLTLFTLILSLLIIFVLRKIPYGNYIAG